MEVPMFLQIYLGVQAVLGIIMIEYAWSRNKRFLIQDEERDKNYPLFRRHDSKYWARWKFYPGAILWLPTRFFGLIIIALTFNIIASLLTCGHDFS